jgi:hypothetical protein
VLSPTPNPTATGKLLKIRQLKQYSVVPSGLLSPFLWRFSAGLTHPRPSTPCQSPSASSTTTGLRREHVPHLTSLHTTFIALVSPVTSSGLAASEKMRCVACVVCAGPETGVGWQGQRQGCCFTSSLGSLRVRVHVRVPVGSQAGWVPLLLEQTRDGRRRLPTAGPGS